MKYDYQEKQEQYYINPRAEMLQYIPDTVRTVLDVGCATGVFARMVQEQRGIRAWGVELNSDAAVKAAAVLEGVFTRPVEECDFGGLRFDCIVFNDVLEHIADPVRTLCAVRPLLTDGGVVVASIPNVRFFNVVWDLAVRGDWEYGRAGVLDWTHLRFFTRRSIPTLFRQAGMEVIRMEGINLQNMGLRYKLLNLLALNRLKDMRCLQFAVVAR